MKSSGSQIFYVSLLLLLCIIAVALLGLMVEFNVFKKDFHKVYFPDYSQTNCLGCQSMMGNSMVGAGYGFTSNVDDDFLNLPDSQWASQATASSSYGAGYGSNTWQAMMATGKPDVGYYGDNGNAWAPQNMSGGTETLTLTFAKSVYATGVNIKESYGSGAIVKVEMGDSVALHTVWEGDDATRGLNYLKIPVEKTSYKVDTVKITFDTSKKSPNEWSEIDAVQLIGK